MLCADDQPRSIEAITLPAQENNPTPLAVIHQTEFILRAGLSSLVNTFNPELVILGSWVADLFGLVILPELLSLVKQQSHSQPSREIHSALSDLEHSPVDLGAATLVLEEFLASARRQPVTAPLRILELETQ